MVAFYEWNTITNNDRLKRNEKICILGLDPAYIHEYSLTVGEKIMHWPRDGRYLHLTKEGSLYDIIDSADRMHVISEKLMMFLDEKVGNQLQLLPVKIMKINKGDYLDEKYFLLNALNMLPAIDMRHSVYKKDPHFPERIQMPPFLDVLRISEEHVEGLDIFRPLELPDCLVVRKWLKEELEENFPILAFNAFGT